MSRLVPSRGRFELRKLRLVYRPSGWSNWAALWQGVHIWTPCENVLGEIATTRWEQILRLSFHSLNCSSIVHEIYHKMCAKYMLGPLYRLLCIIQSFKS